MSFLKETQIYIIFELFVCLFVLQSASYPNVPTKRREFSSESCEVQPCPDVSEGTSELQILQKEVKNMKIYLCLEDLTNKLGLPCFFGHSIGTMELLLYILSTGPGCIEHLKYETCRCNFPLPKGMI